MSDTDREKELARRLGGLSAACRGFLTYEQALLIQEFVDVSEFGVALDWLVAYLAEGQARVPASTVEEIDHLAGIMGISGSIAEERGAIAVEG